MKKLYSSLLVLFLSLTCFAQTTWEGDDITTPNDWATDANWSTNSVPDSTNDVIIPNVANDPIFNAGILDGILYEYVRNISIEENAALSLTATVSSGSYLIIYENLELFNATCLSIGNYCHVALRGDTNTIITSADSIAITGTLNTTFDVEKYSNDDTVYVNCDFFLAGNFTIGSNSVVLVSSGNTLTIEGTLANDGVLIIESGAQLITGGNVTNDGTIHIKDDASYIQTNTASAGGTGDFRISRHLPDGQQGTPASYYTYWGSPVEDGSIGMSGGQMITATRTTIYNDGEDDNKDFVADNYNAMVVGKGYGSYGVTSSSDDGVVGGTFVGTPNNGNISYDLKAESFDGDADDYHYNFVANPYPSAILASEFISQNTDVGENGENIYGTIYVFSQAGAKGSRTDLDGEADYIAINLTGATPQPTGITSGTDTNINGTIDDFHIASCQGFMVIAQQSDNVLEFFSNDMRVSSNNSNFKSGNRPDPILYRFWIELDDEEYVKSTLLGFSHEATIGEDILYDAPNYYLNQYVDVWTESKGNQYEIQCLPPVEEVTEFIPLGVKSSKSGIHHLTLSNLMGWPDNQAVYLFDQKQGIYHDLKNGTYDFYIDEDEKDRPISNRFYLTFIGTGTVGVNDIAANSSIQIVPSNNQIHISSSQSDIAHIEVMDTMGKVLLSQNGNGNKMTINKNFGTQNCIIKVALENGEFKTQLFK